MSVEPIAGIYNYCHRWCERCPFTHRCLVYADARHHESLVAGTTQPHPFAHIYDTPPTPEAHAFFREVEEAQRSLTPADAIEIDREQREADAKVHADPLAVLSRTVSRALWDARATADALAGRDLLLAEAGAIVAHYGQLIGAKVPRALHGWHSARLRGSTEMACDADAMGTAKVARLAVEELLAAVEALAMTAPEDEGLRVAFASLPVLHALLLERFPDAMSFVRPGFDDDAEAGAVAQ